MSHRNFVEKLTTHILCSITFFLENLAVYEIMLENIVEWQATDDNIAHARCMRDT